MTSKKSYSNFCAPLLTENLKRFWPISLVSFIVMFLGGPMLLISSEDSHITEYRLRFALGNQNFDYYFVSLAVSLAAALAMFAYLNGKASVNRMHSMPLTRKSLFITNGLSGLILALVPLVLTCVMLFALKGSVELYPGTKLGTPEAEMQQSIALVSDIYNARAIFSLFLRQFTIIFYTYSLCVLAATICGNSILHALTAVGLNGIVPALYVMVLFYAEEFLDCVNITAWDRGLKMHPVMMDANGGELAGEKLISTAMIIFFAISVMVLELSYFAYTRRKLEKSGESYVFDWVGRVIEVILVVMFASLLGIGLKDIFGYFSFLVGCVIGFLISEMIIRKSFRIFDKRGLKAFFVSLLVVVLLVAGFVTDIMGIADRVPAAAEVDSVELSAWRILPGGSITLKTDEEKALAEDLHRSIVENRDSFDDESYGGNNYTWMTFFYTMKDGRVISREFNVPLDFLKEGGQVKSLYESGRMIEFGEAYKEIDPEKLYVSVNIYQQPIQEAVVYGKGSASVAAVPDRVYEEDWYKDDFSLAERTKLLECLYSDVQNISFEKMIEDIEKSGNAAVGSIYMYHECPLEKESEVFKRDAYYGGSHWYGYEYDAAGEKTSITEYYDIQLNCLYPQTVEYLYGMIK